MPVVLQAKYTGGGTTQGLTNPLTIGHTVVLWQSSRDQEAPEAALTGTGWTYLARCDNVTGFGRNGAFYYRFAASTNETWNLPSSDRNYVLAETDSTLVPQVAAIADTVPSSASMNCGGTVTPEEGDDILLIGGASVGASDTDYDGHEHPITPYGDVTEEVEDWSGTSPLVWLGWSNDASASGSYVVGGTNDRPRSYCGITLLIASSPPAAEVTPPLVCALDDEDLTELVCIGAEELVDWSIRMELQGTGSGYVVIHRSHFAADTDVIKKGNWMAVTIPQIDSEAIFVFEMERITTTLISAEEGGGEVVKVAGRGNLGYFDRAVQHPRSYVVPAGLSVDGIINGPASTGNKAGQVIKRSVDELTHDDRGVTDFGLQLEPLQHLTHDFDYDDDSSGDPWDTTDMTGELSQGYVGEKGLVGVLELIGTGAIDIVMWPTFLLQAFNHYGRNLTGGAFADDVVRFVRGVNIAEELVRDEGLAVDPTHTVVQGSDGTVTAWAFAESPAYTSQPHVEGHVSTFGTDLTALEAVGVAEMSRRLRQGESIQFRVATPRFGTEPNLATGIYLPGPEGTNGNYWLGDEVTLDTGSGFRDYADLSVRVMAITITSDKAGDLEVTVELKGTTLKGRLPPSTGTSFGGGSSSSLGGGGAGGTGGSSAPPPPPGAGVLRHVADPEDAHDASAISVVPFGSIAADNVQDALEEIFDEASGGGDATQVETVGGGSGLPGDTVQEDLDYLANLIVTGTPGTLTAGGSPVAITNDSEYNAFPGIARLDAGRVLLVYRKGSDHASTNDGRIVGKIGTLANDRISVSSWGTEFEIYDHASLDVRCEDAVSVIDGDVWVAGRHYNGSVNSAPFVLKADDDAWSLTSSTTWTKHDVTMAEGSTQNISQGHLVKTDAGTYLLPVAWISGANQFVGAAIVSDPTDWSAPTFETIGSGANDYSEISIKKLPDGTLVAHIRADGPDDHFRSESTDDGATWSSPAMLFDATGFPAFTRLPSGLYLTVYRSNAGSQDAAWRQSEDDTTYSSETILDSTGSQMEYASILPLTRTKSIVVYGVQNSGSDSDIRSQIFTDSSTFGLSISSTPSGPAGGDLSGTYPNPSVVDDSHNHTSATLPTTLVGELLISDTPAGSPLVFADILQDSGGTELLYEPVS